MSHQDTIPEEVWKDVVGYEGYYQVSDVGRVRSMPRIVPMVDGRKYRVPAKTLKPAKSSGGHYLHVILSKSGSETCHLVHRLVLIAFKGPQPEGMQTRHLNGRHTDNCNSNLMWGTSKQNAQDRARHGTNKGQPPGEDCTHAKVSNVAVVEIRQAYDNGTLDDTLVSSYALAYGVSGNHIRRIGSRRARKKI